MNHVFRFKIALQTMKDNFKITMVVTLVFAGMAAMYSGMYPSFKEVMQEMVSSGFAESFTAFRGAADMGSYVGFLNIEMYQIFWILILAMLIGFIAASIIAKEIEGKTIDLFMSNPVSRKQIIFEKYVGLIPFILIVNIVVLLTVYGITIAIDEELNFAHLVVTHAISIPYFLSIAALGILISVLINDKMKASIVTIVIVIGMFLLESISLLIPDYKDLGLVSLTHYYDPSTILLDGEIDGTGVIVLLAFAPLVLILAMIIFEHKDINVS